MAITLDNLYAVLAPVALNPNRLMTYGQLSQDYYALTEDWHDPHGSWDQPLAELNKVLHFVGWPALSAVVVNNETKEPGGGFWESAPSVPPRPANPIQQTIDWGKILKRVQAAPWPAKIPTAPPPAKGLTGRTQRTTRS